MPKKSLTEAKNDRSHKLDEMTALEIVTLMNEEDQTIPVSIQPALPDIASAVEAICDRWEKGGRVFVAGAGTSGRLGMLDAVELGPTFSVPAERWLALVAGGHEAMWQPLEQNEDDETAILAELQQADFGANDVIIGISASGSTPYVLSALSYGNQTGALTISISCNKPARASDFSQVKIEVATGAEIIRGSTRLKAGTAQKIVLNMISTAVMVRLGKVYQNEMVDMQLINKKLIGRAQSMITELAGVTPDEAKSLLEQSGYQVKSALFMAMTGTTVDEAKVFLRLEKGRLKQALQRFFNK